MGFWDDVVSGVEAVGTGGLSLIPSAAASATNNSFQATPAALANTDYSGAIGSSQQGFGANQAQQSAFINQLQGQVNGQGGPSPADLMLQQQTQRNAQASASAIASQRGLNPALAARMTLDQQAQGNQQAAGQGALMKSQEQLQAESMLGGALGQQGQQQLGMFGAASGAQNAQNATTVQNVLGAQQINAGVAEGNAKNAAGIWGGTLNAAGGVLAHLSGGGQVPGRAPVAGNSRKNDTVAAMLSPGEVVLPRTVSHDPEKARAFVEAIRRKSSGERKGYGKVLEHTQKARAALDALEKHVKGRAA